MKQREELTEVHLPRHLVDRIERRLPRTEFDDSSEYIAFVLREVVGRVERETETDADEIVDEQEVENRLQSLGYLDT